MASSVYKIVTIPAPLSFRAAMEEEKELQQKAKERAARQQRIRIRERNAERRQRNIQNARTKLFRVTAMIALFATMAATTVGGVAFTIMVLKWLWYNWILL